ncbi:MAG: 23S rRNA (adenine(2030)-N(6))-methyltransferase RlmJ [Beijerinckiaceae bacterium]
MNYRHGFHAGNFADVFKHVILTRILLYLARKATPFRVIDTHAGEGDYDLASDEATRGGEWRDGIARLADLSDVDEPVRELLRPYLDIVGPFDADGGLAFYPGSPRIVQALMRAGDRATFCELHPEAFAELRGNFKRDRRIACLNLDGYTGLKAGIPPKERRGLVLIDPPFERRDEFERLQQALLAAHAKWPSGTYALWYPVKDERGVAAFAQAIAASGVKRVLRLELAVDDTVQGRLARTGLILVNPPYVLEDEAAILLPVLAHKLARAARGYFVREWLAGE